MLIINIYVNIWLIYYYYKIKAARFEGVLKQEMILQMVHLWFG